MKTKTIYKVYSKIAKHTGFCELETDNREAAYYHYNQLDSGFIMELTVVKLDEKNMNTEEDIEDILKRNIERVLNEVMNKKVH